MSPELTQWITPAILILGFLYLDRSIRSVRSDSRADIKDLRDRMDRQVGDLRNHLDHQFGDLRDRMGRVEGHSRRVAGFLGPQWTRHRRLNLSPAPGSLGLTGRRRIEFLLLSQRCQGVDQVRTGVQPESAHGT